MIYSIDAFSILEIKLSRFQKTIWQPISKNLISSCLSIIKWYLKTYENESSCYRKLQSQMRINLFGNWSFNNAFRRTLMIIKWRCQVSMSSRRIAASYIYKFRMNLIAIVYIAFRRLSWIAFSWSQTFQAAKPSSTTMNRFFHLWLIFLISWVSTTPYVLKAVSRYQYSQPSRRLIAEYHFPKAHFQSTSFLSHFYNPIVTLNMQTNISAINLDNLPGLQRVICNNSKMLVIMESTDALKAWRIHRGTVLLVNPHWNAKCSINSTDAVFLYTEQRTILDSTKAFFHVSEIHPRSFLEDFDITIDHQSNNSSESTKRPFQYLHKGQIFKFFSTLPAGGIDFSCDPECRIEGSAALKMNIKGSGILGFTKAVMKTGLAA